LKLPTQPYLHLLYPFHPTPTPKTPPNLTPYLAEPTPHPHPNLHTPYYPPLSTPSYLKPSFHPTPGTTPIIFSTSNFSKMTPCPCSPHFKT
ncbi:hypothetical protein LINGRAHAP2_LOCUS31488, partial [Linum grandiflorum]